MSCLGKHVKAANVPCSCSKSHRLEVAFMQMRKFHSEQKALHWRHGRIFTCLDCKRVYNKLKREGGTGGAERGLVSTGTIL